MTKILGLWTNWLNQGTDFPDELKNRKFNHFSVSDEAINYLESGYGLIS